ncbi:D-alanyl-D-alanine carboxypeptidase (penicillin-binding protein 5/6) [Amycolatopsis jiangsuensis]|uniref:D-alanyl-D-alanine carboxypeptidase (Penicillin-binding protein 5/6) n=1 Tax=Amycolatopsis jiangsuensis TaxID=1181879 RepID=A0A840IYD1_9PSEU|nr:D-alanyl-D-alanine carboxypeptidase (penicillin-binding protein 5/6) [Amycolatopsis jiangsuensis]
MHNAFRRSRRTLVTALAAGLVAVAAPAAFAVPAQAQQCADRSVPPPPVDTSEQPKPGQPAPPPMPVPAEPVGGPQLGGCGTVLPEDALNPPDGNTAASWVLQDLDTGDVLAAKDPHARERPASLIKTLLALVVVTEMRPDQVVVPTKQDAEQECTCVGIVAGQQYTVDQLMHGLLMHSGNDVAHAFATALGGVDVAVGKMNRLAARLGAMDTRAATPSGLDGPGMSTSAYDLSLIFHYAMKQPEFAQAVATKAYTIPAIAGKPAIPVFNDNKLLGVYPGFLGGKTGFTDDARHTYVGAAQRDGHRLAVVMMRAEQRPTKVVEQAGNLLDYGFALHDDHANPVGRIAYQASATALPEPGTDGNVAAASGAAPAAPAEADPFGTTGWLLTVVVAAIIGAGFAFGHQRKKRVSALAAAQPAEQRAGAERSRRGTQAESALHGDVRLQQHRRRRAHHTALVLPRGGRPGGHQEQEPGHQVGEHQQPDHRTEDRR